MSKDLQYTLSLKDLFSKRMQGAVDSTKQMDSRVSSLSSSFSKLGTAIGGAFAIGGIASFGKSVFNALDNYQQFSVALRTMMHGDALASQALEGKLISLAKTTPFELTEVQDATRKLMAYGVAGGEVTQTIRTLGDVSAGLGKESFPFIIRAFGQIKSKGHLAGQELNQLTEQGFNPLNIIAKKTGESYDTLLKRMEKGKISFKEVEQSFRDVTKEGGQFFNMMEEQSRTVGGKLSNLGDTWEQLKVNIGESQTGIISSTLKWSTALIQNLTDTMSAANSLDEALNKTGVSGAGLFSKIAGRFGFNTVGRKQEGEAFGFQKMIEDSKSFYDVSMNLKVLEVLKKENEAKLKTALGSNDSVVRGDALKEYNVSQSLILDTSKKLKGVATLLKSKGVIPKVTGDGTVAGTGLGSTSQGTGVSLTAQRPQSLIINITKLVENLNLSTTTLKEGTQRIKEEVSKIFLEMVNDVNAIAR